MLIVNCVLVLLAIQASGELEDFESELSNIVGLQNLKDQLNTWARGIALDRKRREMGMKLPPMKPPHLAFLGNPGTGKTTVARMLGKYLHSVGVLSSSNVVEVQRTDLVAEYVGQTGPKTRLKIKEAMGGIMFIDEASRLLPITTGNHIDYGAEALEEIMSVMDGNNLLVIFAGYTNLMEDMFTVNRGLRRRVNIFKFDDFSCNELAEMVLVKMQRSNENSTFYGFKLHSSCTIDSISALIEANTVESLRREMNGGLVDQMLIRGRENLDMRLGVDAELDEMITITLDDLEAGLRLTMPNVHKRGDDHRTYKPFDTVTLDSEEEADVSDKFQSLVAFKKQPQKMQQQENNHDTSSVKAYEQLILRFNEYAPLLVLAAYAVSPVLGYQFKLCHGTAVFMWAVSSADLNKVPLLASDTQRVGSWFIEQFWKVVEWFKQNIL